MPTPHHERREFIGATLRPRLVLPSVQFVARPAMIAASVYPSVLRCVWVPTTTRRKLPERADVTALLRHVSHVVGLRAEEQMVGADAQAVVAAMADEQALGNGAKPESIRHAMRGLTPTTDTKHPICAASVRRCFPNPTLAAPLDLLPKPLLDGPDTMTGVVVLPARERAEPPRRLPGFELNTTPLTW